MKKIKAIIVDPALQMITAVEIDGNLKGLQHAIDDHNIELVRINDKNDMYIDDEGLYRENQKYFILKGDRIIPLAGKAVIVGCDEEGNSIDASFIVTDVAKMIEFKTRDEMFNLSQEGII